MCLRTMHRKGLKYQRKMMVYPLPPLGLKGRGIRFLKSQVLGDARRKKKDKRDLSQPTPREGSQLRPGTSTEVSVHEILDLNFPISEIPSEDVCAHIGAVKLKDLAPGLGNLVEQG